MADRPTRRRRGLERSVVANIQLLLVTPLRALVAALLGLLALQSRCLHHRLHLILGHHRAALTLRLVIAHALGSSRP